MDGVFSLHKILHESKYKKKQGVVFKIDFLLCTYKKCGFSTTWCGWINFRVMCGTLFVKIKNVLGRYFGGHKGVWQGDPISPLIFN
jgi:hypothetical protein